MKTYVLHHERTGSGPTVVLLHGFMASSRYWDRVVNALSSEYRVITIDLLGFGRSPKPGCSRYDYEAHIASIEATLAHAGAGRDFILMGHSRGALIALRYARLNPTRVKRLVLANMPLLLNPQQARMNILGTSMLYRIALRPSMHGIVWPLFRLSYKLRLVPERSGEGLRKRTYIFQSTGISRLRSLKNVIYAAKIESDLKAIQMSTTLLNGLQDKRAAYLQAVMALRLGTRITFRNLMGGHHFPQTTPQLFVELVAG